MISVVIPHWNYDDHMADVLKRCVDSLVGYDELVIVDNDGIGFAKAVNRGLALAHGDYICVVNNDTILNKGSLADLCVKGTVTVPKITGQVDQLPRAFYCMERTIYEQIGGYDEQFKVGYFEDDDMIIRWNIADIPIRTIDKVEVLHIGSETMKNTDRDKAMETNRILFNKKWNKNEQL